MNLFSGLKGQTDARIDADPAQNALQITRCPTCNGNDQEAPCAYPSEGMPGCLRDKRLSASPAASPSTEPRNVTAAEDKWLRDAAKRSGTLIAEGKLAVRQDSGASDRWPTLEAAMADPLFNAARGIMGTANAGQDDALRRAINYVWRRQ